MFKESVYNWFNRIKKESTGALTILGFSSLGIKHNEKNVVSLYYSSVFLDSTVYKTRRTDL